MITFIRRILGVLGLDAATFEDVEGDRTATRQAMLVVVLASIGAGLGNAGIGDDAPRAIVYGTAASLLAWASWAALSALRTQPTVPASARMSEVSGASTARCHDA